MFPWRSVRERLCGVPSSPGALRSITRGLVHAVFCGSLIASVAVPALAWGHGGPDRHRYPLRGVDVSHYQGRINWRAVARDDVSFAYIKATEGVDSRDARFAHNWRGARQAGLRVGAYHYFIFCKSGRAQAHNFLAVAPHGGSTLPPAVDLETGSGCNARPSGPRMRRELGGFLRVVEAREHRRAVLYVTPKFYATYHPYLPRRPMWRRSILSKPAPHAAWAFWQYRSRGRVAGIRTHVDLNVSRAKGHSRAL